MLNESSTKDAQSEVPQISSTQNVKPEAIVRPQRRRELSQERSIDFDRDENIDLGDKIVKKLFPRRAIHRESKKTSRDVSR